MVQKLCMKKKVEETLQIAVGLLTEEITMVSFE